MQITRHWRLNALRYRLEGVRYVNGEVALSNKHRQVTKEEIEAQLDLYDRLPRIKEGVASTHDRSRR